MSARVVRPAADLEQFEAEGLDLGQQAVQGGLIRHDAGELLVLAWLRHRFFHTSFTRSFMAITVGGAIIATLSAGLGIAAAG